MFGSGKRWSVVEYTHRKCLTIDISMMFFISFSLIFLFTFSSPLFFSSLASCFSFAGNLVGFILVQHCRYQLTFQVAGFLRLVGGELYTGKEVLFVLLFSFCFL